MKFNPESILDQPLIERLQGRMEGAVSRFPRAVPLRTIMIGFPVFIRLYGVWREDDGRWTSVFGKLYAVKRVRGIWRPTFLNLVDVYIGRSAPGGRSE